MTIADFIFLILLGIGAYKGYKDGLLVTIISFLAFILGIVAGFKLMDRGMRFLGDYVHNNKVLPFLSFLLIFILVYVLILLLARFLKQAMDYTLLGSFDGIAGALLGAFLITFGVSLLFWLIDIIRLDFLLNIFRGSFFYPKLVGFAPVVLKWISYIIPFQDIFHSLKQTLRG